MTLQTPADRVSLLSFFHQSNQDCIRGASSLRYSIKFCSPIHPELPAVRTAYFEKDKWLERYGEKCQARPPPGSSKSNQVLQRSSLHWEHLVLLGFRERGVCWTKKDLLIALNAISMQEPVQPFHYFALLPFWGGRWEWNAGKRQWRQGDTTRTETSTTLNAQGVFL